MLCSFYFNISNAFRDQYSKYYKKVGLVTLVGVGPDIVRLLILLVHSGVLCGGGAGAQVGVRVLSHVLVGFLGGRGARSLDGFRDVLCGVLRWPPLVV